MALELGGEVARTGVSEFGKTELDGGVGRALRRPARCPDRLDEPPRHGHRAAGGRDGHGPLGGDARRRVRGSRATALRRPVPSRGRAHPVRPGRPQELPLRRRRRAARVDARRRDRGAGGADPQAGRVGAGHLRALGWGRLRRRRPPRLQGDRRPAHLRLRRPRLHARERGGAGGRDLRRALPGAARARGRAGALPGAARGRRRARGEAPSHRRGVHPRLRGGGEEARCASATSSRARSTAT